MFNLILAIVVALLCLVWTVFFVRLIFNLMQIPDLQATQMEQEQSWPGLSIVIAACNEELVIEHAIETVLKQDYPGLEIIVINDRSTDSTGAIIDRAALKDSRVKALHIEHLPDQWLGKVHALHQGIRQSSGEWVLLTDADIHFRPGILQQAMNFAKYSRTDHVVVFPRIVSSSFLLQVAIMAFEKMLLAGLDLSGLKQAGKKSFVGVGAFNMVNRSFLDKTPGLSWLRMEVTDDMGLGYLVKEHGGTTAVAHAGDSVKVDWYSDVGAMFKGLEKNAFGPGLGYSYLKFMLLLFALLLVCLAPLIALMSGNVILQIFGVLCYCELAASLLVAKQRFGRKLLPGLLFQPGMMLIMLMMLNSAVRCWFQGGVRWRGTLYTVADLKKGQRIRFF